MNKEVESFRQLCSDPRNAVIKDRWQRIVDQCIERAAAKGIRVSAEELVTLPVLRIHAISGVETGDWEADAKLRLPQWRARAEVEAAYHSLNDENATDQAKDAAAAKFAAMNPAERMKAARAAGHQLPKGNEARKPLDAAEHARLSEKLASMDVSPSYRLQLARQWGLV